MREAQFQSILRMKELEVQYQQARYEGQRKAQEQEASKSKQLTSQVSTFSQTETELRSQLNIYVEKFKQVSSVCDTRVKALHIQEIRQSLAASVKELDTSKPTPESTSKAQKTRWDQPPLSPEPPAASGPSGSFPASAPKGTVGALATPRAGTTTMISREEMTTTFATMFAVGPDGEQIGEPIWTSTALSADPQTSGGSRTALPSPPCTSLPRSRSSTSAASQAPKAPTSFPKLSLQTPQPNVPTKHKRDP
jgi:hypothetical protein